jgi:uncharacterized membrane protein YgcG
LVRAREQMSALSSAPALPADALAARRRQFLSTARAYKRQTTSTNPLRRLGARVWPMPRAGQPALLPALARAVIAFVLVLSLMGGMVAAAQSSLPDSPLYGIKLTAEDARLALTREPAQQAALAMTFASERAREMERLAVAQRPMGRQVSIRLQNQLDAALSAAARAPEPEMLRALDKVRTIAQAQAHALAQAQLDAPPEASTQDALRQAEQAMAQAQRQAESGLADPNAFRKRYGRQPGVPGQPTPEATATPQPPTPTVPAQPTTAPEATSTPQVTVTPQRNPAWTGQPPTSAPGPHITGTPQRTGPGPQPTAGQGGPGPQATGTPEGYPGGKPKDGSGSGGGGGTGGNSGGGTRRP